MYDPARGYPPVVPYVLYRDPGAASAWLADVLGFREVLRLTVPGSGLVGHVELERDGAIVMLGPAGSRRFGTTASITLVFVDDVAAACERAVAAGGTVQDGPADQPFGLRQAIVADPEGQRWELSQHLRDVPPAEWGAVQHARCPAERSRPALAPAAHLPGRLDQERHLREAVEQVEGVVAHRLLGTER